MNGDRDSVTRGSGREAAAELVASEEYMVMLWKVDLDTRSVDRVSRLELWAYNLLKCVTWGLQSRIEQCLCERRGACEPPVEEEEAGEIAEDDRREDCLINYLCRGQRASLTCMRGAFYRD